MRPAVQPPEISHLVAGMLAASAARCYLRYVFRCNAVIHSSAGQRAAFVSIHGLKRSLRQDGRLRLQIDLPWGCGEIIKSPSRLEPAETSE